MGEDPRAAGGPDGTVDDSRPGQLNARGGGAKTDERRRVCRGPSRIRESSPVQEADYVIGLFLRLLVPETSDQPPDAPTPSAPSRGAGAIVGFRTWRLDIFDGKPVLRGSLFHQDWTVGLLNRADAGTSVLQPIIRTRCPRANGDVGSGR